MQISELVDQLRNMLEELNKADHTGDGKANNVFASQRHVFGKIWDALELIHPGSCERWSECFEWFDVLQNGAFVLEREGDYALCERQNGPTKLDVEYVTWLVDDRGYAEHGHYFGDDRLAARMNLRDRAAKAISLDAHVDGMIERRERKRRA